MTDVQYQAACELFGKNWVDENLVRPGEALTKTLEASGVAYKYFGAPVPQPPRLRLSWSSLADTGPAVAAAEGWRQHQLAVFGSFFGAAT